MDKNCYIEWNRSKKENLRAIIVFDPVPKPRLQRLMQSRVINSIQRWLDPTALLSLVRGRKISRAFYR